VSDERTTLREIAVLFLRLGATAFGGPAAHVAMMEDEVVRRRKWLSEERFLDLLGATNLIPGPNSTEMAIHIGWGRRRWSGLLVAGVAFILPAMLITGALGYVYARFGTVPTARWLLYGVKPVILAVVAQALWGLAPKAARTAGLRVLGVVAAGLVALGVHELAVLFGGGLAVVVLTSPRGAPGGGVPRRRQRRLARAHGRGDGADRAHRAGRPADGDPRAPERRAPAAMEGQLDVARARGSDPGLAPPHCAGCDALRERPARTSTRTRALAQRGTSSSSRAAQHARSCSGAAHDARAPHHAPSVA
jgi:chromate transport protein ChrA